MRVLFSNVDFNSYTGPNQFGFKLANELMKNGVEVTPDQAEDHDLCLAFIENYIETDKPLIQRLDGIWFKPDDFIDKNKHILQTYNSADGIIFQSEFDKIMIEKHFGKRDVPSRVIHNGTYAANVLKDKNIKIEWLENIKKDFSKVFVASSQWTNRPHKRLDEIIRFVNEYSEWSGEKCCLVTLGNSDKFEKNTEIFYSESFIQIHLGNVLPSQSFVPVCYADWFLHFAYLDHCPNVVVDALACQVPVICSSTGGTKEIVRDRGFTIQEEVFDFELCDYTNPPKMQFEEKYFKVIKNGYDLKDYGFEKVADMHISNTASQYVDFFNKVLNS